MWTHDGKQGSQSNRLMLLSYLWLSDVYKVYDTRPKTLLCAIPDTISCCLLFSLLCFMKKCLSRKSDFSIWKCGRGKFSLVYRIVSCATLCQKYSPIGRLPNSTL